MPPADPASLKNLHDILEPPPVPWWPLAPGWYALAAVLLVVALALLWRFWRRWRAAGYRRAALQELRGLLQLSRESARREAALRALPELVKRTALAAFPREEVAPLSGTAWLQFLDRTGDTNAFTKGSGRRLEALAYKPAAAVTLGQEEADQLIQLVSDWTRDHRDS